MAHVCSGEPVQAQAARSSASEGYQLTIGGDSGRSYVPRALCSDVCQV